ncbi:hypothetical protein OUZ56_019048 [Daphnia magna]|uniref:Uncharacterized protein n=1 Tax=Daphnia magna TaxID=35525 RepID=A0ABQ9ZAI1_9CRUS|nr:hypothetical protein OUZ56_019048 [Daphnia magna]
MWGELRFGQPKLGPDGNGYAHRSQHLIYKTGAQHKNVGHIATLHSLAWVYNNSNNNKKGERRTS